MACLDFDKAELVAPDCHDIDFAAAYPEIPVTDGIPLPGKIPADCRFTEFSGVSRLNGVF